MEGDDDQSVVNNGNMRRRSVNDRCGSIVCSFVSVGMS